MDGLEIFFETLKPTNFWDTDSSSEKDFGSGSGRYDESDWDFYRSLREPQTNTKRLTLYAGSAGQFYNRSEKNEPGGDGLSILAPTPALVRRANESGDYNDCSYVVLYRTSKGHRILFAGDSHDVTWDYILGNHEARVRNVDVLIAPHHGRASDRSYDFLNVVNPALTLFGNADSTHLSHAAYSNRGLPKITNNQAGSILIDADDDLIQVYVACQAFARKSNPQVSESLYYSGYYYWGPVQRRKTATP